MVSNLRTLYGIVKAPSDTALRERLDEVQQHCCGLFRAALAKQGRKRYFREKLRSFFFTWLLPDWETLYRALAYGSAPTAYDTS